MEGKYDMLTEWSLVIVAHIFIAVLGKQRQRGLSMSLDLALKEQITYDLNYMRHFNLANSENRGKNKMVIAKNWKKGETVFNG